MSRRCQPRIKGGRDGLFSAVLPETRDRIIDRARRYNVSPSWVVATILADAVGGIKRQPRYETARQVTQKRSGKKLELVRKRG